MTETTSDSSFDIRGLILVPAVITLVITCLRLAGELGHWSHILFNTAAGGGMAIIGISWLPFIFGPYFAVKLVHAGHGPSSAWKTFGLTALGFVILIAGGVIGFAPQIKFPGKVILGILLMLLGPALVMFGWPDLFKTLVAYGYAARIPVGDPDVLCSARALGNALRRRAAELCRVGVIFARVSDARCFAADGYLDRLHSFGWGACRLAGVRPGVPRQDDRCDRVIPSLLVGVPLRSADDLRAKRESVQ